MPGRSSARTHSLISRIGETAATARSDAMRMIAVLAGELQREIAAERIAGYRDVVNAIDVRQFFDHVLGVCRQAGVKEPGRQMFRLAAISLIEPDDVHARGERL